MQPIDIPGLALGLYDAALEPTLWPEALTRIVRAYDTEGAQYGMVDPNSGEATELALVGGDFDISAVLREHVRNPWTLGLLRAEIGTTITSEDLAPLDSIRGTEFYEVLVRPARLSHGMGSLPARDGRSLVCCSLWRLVGSAQFDGSDFERFAPLIPHLGQAAKIAMRFAKIDVQRAAALEALEWSAAPIALVDTSLRPTFVNAAARALLARREGVELERGVLIGRSAAGSAALRQAISMARAIAAGEGAMRVTDVRLPRGVDEPPLLATVAPLRVHALHVGGRAPIAAIFFALPEAATEPPLELLIALFDLTPAEARVAALTSEGHGLAHVADALDVTLPTVRTHLARAFAKTGTRRQAELTSLVLRLGGQRPRRARPS
jgi:DNA-binding CsgD family transcriptional regulator